MSGDFFEKLIEMRRGSEPFATAYVVSRESPSSGKPGDKAIIDKNGKIYGWVGGGCTKGIILKEALLAISDGKPRLVAITSSSSVSRKTPGVKHYDMTCQSKGSIEVYVEPVLPKPHIAIFGKSHIAAALVPLCNYMGYSAVVVGDGIDADRFSGQVDIVGYDKFDPEMVGPAHCIVVCTQGEGDEQALQAALKTRAGYIAFVSSRMKANSVFNTLRMTGVNVDELKRVKTPAGLDINAKMANEVAVSILAEIISYVRAEKDTTDEPTVASTGRTQASHAAHGMHGMRNTSEEPPVVPEGYYLNPVCNIPIEKNTAKYVLDYKGESVYFCCDGCKIAFEANPAQYMEPEIG